MKPTKLHRVSACALALALLLVGSALAQTAPQNSNQIPTAASSNQAIPPPVVRDYGFWTSSFGADYSTGKYGDVVSTTIWSFPFNARYDYDRWTFAGTLPFVRISGPADVLPGVGGVFTGRVRPSSQTESGLGDLTVGAGYSWMATPNEPAQFHLDSVAKIKFPTADRDKGLGTGQTDVSLQADVYQAFGNITPFGTLGYRVMGDPSGIDYRNYFFTSLGASVRLTSAWTVGGSYDWRQKLVNFGDEESELTAFTSWRMSREWKFSGYLLTGFTHASPDFGAGATMRYTF